MQYSYCTNAIMSERHSLRNVEHSNRNQLKQMQTSFHNIFCIWHRYNVLFASLKCARLALKLCRFISISYVWDLIEYNCMIFWCFEKSTRKFNYASYWDALENVWLSLIQLSLNNDDRFIHWSKVLSISRTIFRENQMFY